VFGYDKDVTDRFIGHIVSQRVRAALKEAGGNDCASCDCPAAAKAGCSNKPTAVGSGDLWQPIERAPKDGRTLLLGYANELGNWRTMRGQWFTKAAIDEDWEEPDGFDAGWYETAVEPDYPPNCWSTAPTHWQPLPARPTANGAGGQAPASGTAGTQTGEQA
jgi:hypothetical protein